MFSLPAPVSMRPASTNLRADIFHGPDPLELQQAGGGGVEGRPPGPDLSPVTVLLDTGDIYSKKNPVKYAKN